MSKTNFILQGYPVLSTELDDGVEVDIGTSLFLKDSLYHRLSGPARVFRSEHVDAYHVTWAIADVVSCSVKITEPIDVWNLPPPPKEYLEARELYIRDLLLKKTYKELF